MSSFSSGAVRSASSASVHSLGEMPSFASYTNEIISAAKDYDPTKVTRYVTQLATLFHKFYNACRVKGEEEGLMQARLALCNCVRAVIKNVLTMFNISCPESM